MSTLTEGLSQEKFVDDLGKLVSFRTVNKDDVATRDQAPFDEAMNFIREQIDPRAHVEIQTHENAQFLLAGNTWDKNPDICNLVHVDVVPVTEGNEHQFEMKVDGDLALGRGAS